MTNNNSSNDLGRILKQRRVMISLALRGLAAISGMSYNTIRPHQSLLYLTPGEFLERWEGHEREAAIYH